MSLLATFLFVVGVSHAEPGEDYRIGPGDVVSISIYGHDFGTDTFPVSADGEVSLPYVGMVAVAGRTSFEAEEVLRKALLDGYFVDPHVTVRIREYRSKMVEVLGAVKEPGGVYLDGPTSVRSVLGEAGGVDAEKSTGQIVVTAQNGEVLYIPLAELEGPLGDHQVGAGDVIRVDEGRLVFVAGEVQEPGAVPFVEGITVLEALLRAGGSTPVARLAGAYVLREGEKLQVNLRRVMKGKGADIALQPGDRIVVPESPI